jgi:uncharacterized protein
VVEQMLDHASNAPWPELDDLLSPDFEIVEPGSLPYGGVHRGVHGYVALMQTIDALFELSFEPQRLIALDDADVLLRMTVTFTARTTGRSARLRVLELLRVDDGRVQRSEVFLDDTAELLATLAT